MSELFESGRSYRRIANILATRIENGEYREGEALPGERELAKQLNVSRTSIREAVIALEVSGLLEVKTGSGIYVSEGAQQKMAQPVGDLRWRPDPELAAFLESQQEISPFNLLQARLLIEPEIAALAAKNMTDENLHKIKEAYVMSMQENLTGSTTHIGDRLMHIRIAEACGNEAYEMIIRELLGHQHSRLFAALQKHYTPKDMPMRSQYEHLSIVMALEEQNATAARSAMKKHLQNVVSIFRQAEGC